ncbi:DUF397 domain-containing protein [Actinomadura atramentaria]|uniref:DUF397 domain-containing protein n=1 Tax=Actinomadura atramentaria TaxID=1990 RepID=UPI0004754DE9|nr:DUF397 domain-containing protein [Actinomadura atramentaria]
MLDLSGVLWRKSSRSDEHGGECVEVAAVAAAVAMRDSKDPDGPKLVVNRSAFTEFIHQVEGEDHA